jgi:hypothetical protein
MNAPWSPSQNALCALLLVVVLLAVITVAIASSPWV